MLHHEHFSNLLYIFFAVYSYGWAVLFRGSIIRPGYADEKVNSKLSVCVCVCDNKNPQGWRVRN